MRRAVNWAATNAATMCFALAGVALAGPPAVQSDWSGGATQAGPVLHWGDEFDAHDTVAWRSLPGQVALGGVLRAAFERVTVAQDAGQPRASAIGDLDGDGRNDLISGEPVVDPFNPIGAIYWWRAEADGTFTQHSISDTYWGINYITTSDLDRDGDLDVVAAAYYGVADPPPPPPESRNGRYTWFENVRGDGSAWSEHTVGELFWGAEYVDVGDFDGDGDIDLVGASYLTRGGYEQDSDITWFENLDGAAGEWAMHEVAAQFDNGYEAHFVDLDSDDDLDILATHADLISWWENTTGDGSALAHHVIDATLQNVGYVAAGDVDNDGDIDVVGSTYSTTALFWYENTGDALAWNRRIIGTNPNCEEVNLADYDGDGDLDVVADAADRLDGILRLFTNDSGDGAIWGRRDIAHEPDTDYFISTGDADMDGQLDLVVASEDIRRALGKQLTYFNLTMFVPQGELTSSILDGGAEPGWGAMTWDADVPADTTLSVQVRASDDDADLGGFIDVPASGTDLANLIDSDARYFQYRMSLRGTPDASPVIREVEVERSGSGNGLVLSGPAQGIAGASNEFIARSDQVGERIYFAGSLARGATEIPTCPGVFAGLARPRLAGSARVDERGEAHLHVHVPAAARGRVVYFQALHRDDCVVSNVIGVPFE